MTQSVAARNQVANNVHDRYKSVLDAIDRASRNAGRTATEIGLLAVSKTRRAEEIRALAELGHRDFGENYVAEAVPKIQELLACSLTWHFIGTVQSNKTRLIAQHFDWVQSVDRELVAKRLNAARQECNDTSPLNVCIQVNIDDETQKSGVTVENLPCLFQSVQEMPYIRLRGLMAIPKMQTKPEFTRTAFSNLYKLFQDLEPVASEYWDTLSIGMTHDYRIAIEEGATMVRLGTAIFGPRA